MKQKSGGIKRLMEFTENTVGCSLFPASYPASVRSLSLDRSSAFTLQRVTWWAYLPGRR